MSNALVGLVVPYAIKLAMAAYAPNLPETMSCQISGRSRECIGGGLIRAETESRIWKRVSLALCSLN